MDPPFGLAGLSQDRRWKRVRFDRSHMAIDAAAGGMGVALESAPMTEREVAGGTLVRPVARAPDIRTVTQGAVCRHDRLRHREVRLVLDRLREGRDAWPAACGAVLQPRAE